MRCAGSKGVYPSHHLTGRRFVTNTYNWFSNKIEICRLRLSILAIFRRSPLLEVTDRLWRSMARMPNTFACPKAKKSIDISITSFKCVGLSGDCTAHQSNCGYATHGGEQKNESSHEGMEVHQRFGERWDEWRKKFYNWKVITGCDCVDWAVKIRALHQVDSDDSQNTRNQNHFECAASNV